MNKNYTENHHGRKPKKYRSAAAIVLSITLIAAAVLALIVLFINMAGIRYIRIRYENGDVKYFGTVDDKGQPLEGTLVYENGIRAKVNQAKSEILYSNGDLYDGPLENLLRHGEGRLIYQNGDVYEGNFWADSIDGQGTYSYINGDVYEGEFKQDKMHGEGTYTWADGTTRSGRWKNGTFVG